VEKKINFMKKYFISFAGVLFIFPVAFSQPKKISLSQVIELAKSQSPGYKLAQTQKEINYYEYLTYKSEFNPQISFYGNAPVYNKEYFGVRQPDGAIKFQSINQNYANLGFGISQQIPLTGGEISLNTDLTRFDDFNSKTKRYNGTPIYFRLSQPLFAFNELKWRKKIEPLKFEESKREYIQEIETLAQQSVKLYFDLLDVHNNIIIATSNLKAAEVNYEIEQKRINLGTTTEDKLLQLELQVLINQQNLEKARYAFQIAQLNLKTFIGLKDNDVFEPLVPQIISSFTVHVEKAIEHAKQNRAEFISFERKRQEAQRNLAQAKAAKQQVNLVASYGLNNIGDNISSIYRDPRDQQRLNLGFNIPIIDWGRRSARYNTTRALEKLTAFNNELDEAVLLQEIITLVTNFELLKGNIAIARKTDSVAQRRYGIANNLYQVGKLTISDLGRAQDEKDNAQRDYISALRAYWDIYYMLRRITLYDFENNLPLINKD
jgi:outer membrane protein TolC